MPLRCEPSEGSQNKGERRQSSSQPQMGNTESARSEPQNCAAGNRIVAATPDYTGDYTGDAMRAKIQGKRAARTHE
jgi:hypothetical protein